MTVEELEAAGVRAMALVLVDNGGITRMKCVPIGRLAHAAERGIGWSSVWGLALADDSFAHAPGLCIWYSAASSPPGSTVLREAMGEYLHDRVVAVRHAEAEASAGLDEEALVARHRWRY